MIVALIFSNYAQLNIAMKIIDSIIEKEQPKNMQENFSLKKSVDYLQIVSFWILIVAIYTSALLSEATNNMALRFVVVADKNMALAQNFAVDDKSLVVHKKKGVGMKLVADNISALIADILEIVEELDYKNMVA